MGGAKVGRGAVLALALASAGARGEAAEDPAASPPGAPPPLVEEMVVTATRSPRTTRDAPTPVTAVGRDQIERSPSKTVDEILRAVPSFGTLRQSSSLVAD